MGEVITLRGSPTDLTSDLGRELVVEFVRYVEGLTDEATIRKKFRFDNKVWEKLGSDDAFVEAVDAEKVRRVRDGSTKREKSQRLITKAPDILDNIMCDTSASPRHRVDAIKTLDGFAANGPAAAPASDRFVITINLSADGAGGEPKILHFDKSIAISANDGDRTNDIETEWLPVIAAKNSEDGGDGGHL